MPSIRDDLRRRLYELLRGQMPTDVPDSRVHDLAQDATVIMERWLREVYETHSVEASIIGEPAPYVIRPSYEWLCESMKA